MGKNHAIDWPALIAGIVGVLVVIGIGYVVLQEQVVAVHEYCQELVNNHTIQNISECNVTVQGLAQIRGENISVVR